MMFAGCQILCQGLPPFHLGLLERLLRQLREGATSGTFLTVEETWHKHREMDDPQKLMKFTVLKSYCYPRNSADS